MGTQTKKKEGTDLGFTGVVDSSYFGDTYYDCFKANTERQLSGSLALKRFEPSIYHHIDECSVLLSTYHNSDLLHKDLALLT